MDAIGPIARPSLCRRLSGFGAVGLAGLALNFALYRTLLAAGMAVPLVVVTTWAAGLGLAFFGNKRIAFGVKAATRGRHLGGFALAYGAQLGVGLAGYHVTLDMLGLPPTAAFVIVLFPTSVVSFAVMNRVAFRPSPVPA